VSNQRNPFRINVGFLANQPVGTFREIHFETGEYRFSSDFMTRTTRGVIKFSRTPQGILAEGNFHAESNANCVRCLMDYNQLLDADFKELYSYIGHPTNDDGMIIPEDGNIDLAPIIREYLLLDMPIKSLCRADCKGLCPVCGENLNVTTCVHQSEGGS